MKHMSFTCNITVVVLMLLSAAAISAQQGEYITLEAENIKSFRENHSEYMPRALLMCTAAS